MTKSKTKLPPAGGNLHGHNSTAVDPYAPRSFGKAPVVGQSKPYGSGANAHGKVEKKTVPPAPGSKSGHAAASKPKQKGY